MKYLSGVHALNIPCKLETGGDWHASALLWQDLSLSDSENSIFGTYGIEENKAIPEHKDKYNVANHIRACLDLLQAGRFAELQGMNKDFIVVDKYDDEIFSKIILLKDNDNWVNINDFLSKEYGKRWILWINGEKSINK